MFELFLLIKVFHSYLVDFINFYYGLTSTNPKFIFVKFLLIY